MKIFTAAQLQKADQLTIEREPITSTDLMERAATKVFQEIHQRLQGAPVPIKIFCGIGNNGGDGLVIARQLMEHGYHVTTYVVNYSDRRSKDFLINYDRIKNTSKDWPMLIKGEADFPALSRNDFIVDALFGLGLNRPVTGWTKTLIQHINAAEAFILSIDIPSGLFADQALEPDHIAIQADFTLTFQSLKTSFLLPQSEDYVGDFQVVDIGLDRDFLHTAIVEHYYITREEVIKRYKPRKKFSHKGTYGHVLMVGGSLGKMGSISLATSASLEGGVGLVTAVIPICGIDILQTTVPEAMVLPSSGNYYLNGDKEVYANINDLDPTTVCFGMGAGQQEKSVNFFKELIKCSTGPMVIDADGINILAEYPDMISELPSKSVLTPHPKELQRLIGLWNDDFEKLQKTKAFALEHDLIILIKGAHTVTVTAKEYFFNSTGNPGMATAGSGDVLAGIIASFMAQGYAPQDAAIIAVYLHGKSGDISADQVSMQGVTAKKIIDHLGLAILDLFKRPETTAK